MLGPHAKAQRRQGRDEKQSFQTIVWTASCLADLSFEIHNRRYLGEPRKLLIQVEGNSHRWTQMHTDRLRMDWMSSVSICVNLWLKYLVPAAILCVFA